MASATEGNTDWAAAMQKAQADLLRQWSDLSQAWAQTTATATGSGPTAAAAAPGQATDALVRHFLQQCEQYLGVSRSLWELVGRAAAQADPEQRSRLFTDGLTSLQQQFASLWVATPFGAPASGGYAGGLWPGAAPFAGGFPGMAAMPGFGAMPGLGAMPGFGAMPGMGAMPGLAPMPGRGGIAGLGMPGLGPTREQHESWQRVLQALARSAQAQLQVSTQWNEIIGRALRELAERLAPRLKSGSPPGSLKEVYDLWVDAAENVYAQAARGGSFVQAQAELTNATSQLRSAQRELLEDWARQFDLPTRAELNSIHQQLRELKAALFAAKGPA
jgi:hypothetical protein